MSTTTLTPQTIALITPETLLAHWQGHRGLTRKMIEAFPDDKLFTYSLGGMRPFSDLVYEFLGMEVPILQGIVTSQWPAFADAEKVTSKQALLALWDEATAAINALLPTVPTERWHQQDVAFGMYPGTCISFVFYAIDNEIHHRGQAYVYLRSLGIEPPAFWDRA